MATGIIHLPLIRFNSKDFIWEFNNDKTEAYKVNVDMDVNVRIPQRVNFRVDLNGIKKVLNNLVYSPCL